MKPKHTPLPWKHRSFRRIKAIDITSVANTDRIRVVPIAIIGDDCDRSFAEHKRNAEFIVRACNAHYDLISACENALAFLGQPFQADAAERILAAIAKAEGN